MNLGNVQAFYPATTQIKAYTTSAAITNAFAESTHIIRVVASTACHIKIAKTPTATTSDPYLPADVVEYFIVNPGQKIAAVQVSDGGNLNVTEMTK